METPTLIVWFSTVYTVLQAGKAAWKFFFGYFIKNYYLCKLFIGVIILKMYYI